MRSISTLTTLFLLSTALAAPSPSPNYPPDCHDASCTSASTSKERFSLPRGGRPSIARINLSWQPPAQIPHPNPASHKPLPKKESKSEPHFPGHQLSPPAKDDSEPINNTPHKPSPSTPAAEALSAQGPLESSYLLSLSKSNPAIAAQPHSPSPSTTTPQTALPAKPSSALPELRRADAARYWASRPASQTKPEAGAGRTAGCLGGEGVGLRIVSYSYRVKMGVGREYADLIVVGIVVLFLAVVVGLEAAEKWEGWRLRNSGRTVRRARRGAIFLADDETLAYIVPKPRYEIQEYGYLDEKEGLGLGRFEYDSDADAV